MGAIGKDALEVIAAMYRAVLNGEVHTVSSPIVAEMEKILENTYRNVNIGLINELAMFCERMKVNLWEVIEAAKTKPYGFQAFYPGPGLGGHCIPLDPYYLSWKAREYGFHTTMIESSMMINDRMPDYCIQRIYKLLNKEKKSINGSKILVLGVAYKQDIDDYRGSPALAIIDKLKKAEGDIVYYDPYVAEYIQDGFTYKGEKELTAALIQSADIVVVTTAHTKVDYQLVQQNAKMIFDTKNAMAKISNRTNIEVL